MPTVREPDGLAMSSRNSRLAPRERSQAAGLYAALSAARKVAGRGERAAEPLLRAAGAVLADYAIEAEYLALVDSETFAPVQILTAAPAVLAIAASVGGTRLIDNVIIETAA